MSRRVGFSTLGCPGVGLEGVVRLIEGSDARTVELRLADDEPVWPGMDLGEAAELGRRIASAGAEVLCLSGYVQLCGPDEGELGASLDLAAAVGARGVRVFMRDEEPGGDALTAGELRAIRTLRALGPRDETVFVETHDSHSSAERMTRFFIALDAQAPGHPARVLWDTAHTWGSGEEPGESLALLEPWLAHLQVKDIASRADPVPVALGTGSYPVEALAAALGDRPVDLVLEWERRWHPELPTLEDALDRLGDWARPLLRT